MDQSDLYIFLLIFIDLLLISIDLYWSLLIGIDRPPNLHLDQLIHIDPIGAIDPIDLPSPDMYFICICLPDHAFQPQETPAAWTPDQPLHTGICWMLQVCRQDSHGSKRPQFY